MSLRTSGPFWVGVLAFVFGGAGAILFAKNVASDHSIDPHASGLGVSNLNAVTASDTAWMWGCIVVAVLGAVLTVTLIVRSRRD